MEDSDTTLCSTNVEPMGLYEVVEGMPARNRAVHARAFHRAAWQPVGMSGSPVPDQTGRIALITGANSGLGLETARALAGAGATVVLACRNPSRAERALEQVAAVATAGAPRSVALDLADLESIAAAAEEVAATTDRLDILVNNAGIMAVPRAETHQGFESQFGVNHLGHFALTGHLLPTLLAAPAPRVVTVSSVGHRSGRISWDDLDANRGYHRWLRYGQSKLANLLFTSALNRRAGQHGTALIAVAAHPGYAATSLTHNGPGGAGRRPVMDRLVGIGDALFAQSATDGARPQIHAATATEVVGNDYFGPDGPFEQRGKGVRRVGRSARAADSDDADRLWTVSEEKTGVVYAWPDDD